MRKRLEEKKQQEQIRNTVEVPAKTAEIITKVVESSPVKANNPQPDTLQSINLQEKISLWTRVVECFSRLWESLCNWWNEKFLSNNLNIKDVKSDTKEQLLKTLTEGLDRNHPKTLLE